MADTKAGASSIPAVDLVVVIDSSASMRDEAVDLSKAVSSAIEAAKVSCPSDLRVEYLGVEGTFSDTKFTTTVRKYLTDRAKADPAKLKGRLKGAVAEGGAQEDGALAIEDVTNHFDWRQGAKKAILYLTDEALYGGGLVDQEDIDAATAAINTAKAGEVRVHTYLGTSRVKAAERKKLESELARVSNETGGKAFTAKDALNGFQKLLEEVICGSRTTPGSAEDVPCEDCGKPEVPPKKESPAAPPPEKEHVEAAATELYAIVMVDNRYQWKGNSDDNGDIHLHDALTGKWKHKLVNNQAAIGQSNGITSDGWHYFVWNMTQIYRRRITDEKAQRLSALDKLGGWPSIDSMTFRKDDTAFAFYAQKPEVIHFKHDPSAAPQFQRKRLVIKPAPGTRPVPFGSQRSSWVTDVAFDGDDRAYLIGNEGAIWIVDDTRSETEWIARLLCTAPGLPGGDAHYTGIAFGPDGGVFLCGGLVESRVSCRRFITRLELNKPASMELVYDGGPRSGSYANLSSRAFPKISKV